MILRLITPPAVEPVSISEALNQCHANAGEEDNWFLSRIRAGRAKVEDRIRRSLITQTWELSLDAFPDEDEILLPRSPIQSVVSIKAINKTNQEQTLALSNFVIDTDSQPGRILPVDKWPVVEELRKANSIKIRYTAGYGVTSDTVPEPLKDAILLYVAHAYNNRSGEVAFPQAFFNLIEPNRLYL